MRYVTFDFDGSPLPLMLTAGALFDIYDRFGVHDSILRATGAMADTPQGWMACCELAELLMQQAGVTIKDRKVACKALEREAQAENGPAAIGSSRCA